MDKDFLIKYLSERNYWWNTGKIEEYEKGIERKDYISTINKILNLNRIVCLVGIRRSGKTTLLFQLMDLLLGKNDPKRIVYVKIDDILSKIDNLRDITSVYHELTGIDPKSNRVYFLLDEIHFMKDWQLQIKYFIDSHYKSKFIVSGSSKTMLYKDASESLVGRIRFVDVFPLTFREFLRFNGMELNLKEGMEFKTIKENYYNLISKKEEILHFLRLYLEVGAFPEWFRIKDRREWQKTLVDDYLSLILFKDIVHVFKVKDPLLLEKLIHEIATLSTNRFSYLSLSNRLDADRETIKLYLYYLKASSLIYISEVYFRRKKSRERLEKKMYFWEEGLRRALTLDDNEGKSIENVVVWHLIKKGMKEKPFFEPFYWKNRGEVDFIFDGKKILPVEIKYRENPLHINSLIEFLDKFSIDKGVVVTKDFLDEKIIKDKKILFIPAWLFLLYL